jgi:predicted ATP-grasp superfamily ATP-dependent carboligase
MRSFLVVGKSRRVVVAVLQAIRSHGDEPCAVVGGSDTGSLRWSPLCQRYAMMDFGGDDDARFLDLAREMAVAWPSLCVIAGDCDGIRLINRVRHGLDIPIAPLPVTPLLDSFDDKWQFHRFCTRYALPVPLTVQVGAKRNADFAALSARLGLPFMLKPVDQAGSLGVKLITSRAQFEREVLHDDGYCFEPLIAQRFIDGEDIDLSLLSLHGKLAAFAIQQVAGAEIRFVPNAELEDIAHALCAASGFHGVMHVDARIERTTGEVYLIESNPRFWASLTAAAWCGLNFVTASVQGMRDEPEPFGDIPALTAGTAYLRHPLLRPSCWRQLLGNMGARGRLLRAVTFDGAGLYELLSDMPTMCRRRWQGLAAFGAHKAWNPFNSLAARMRKS